MPDLRQVAREFAASYGGPLSASAFTSFVAALERALRRTFRLALIEILERNAKGESLDSILREEIAKLSTRRTKND